MQVTDEMVRKLNEPKENTQTGLALVGPYGNVWHDALFQTPEAAIRYLTTYWRGVAWEPQNWKVVQATQTITPLEGAEEFALSNYMPKAPSPPKAEG
jgi:hypothetical protein